MKGLAERSIFVRAHSGFEDTSFPIPPSTPSQGPRTKDLSPLVVDLLCNAPTSLIIWPPDAENTALGQRAAPSDDGSQVWIMDSHIFNTYHPVLLGW